MHRGFRYRLEPTSAQAKVLREWIGATRFVYNLALEQRRDFWRQYLANTGRHLSWASQSREVTALRAAAEWINATPRMALEAALRDLDAAYSAFFAGRAKYPTPRRKGVHDAIRLRGTDVGVKRLNARWAAVRLPRIGWVKYRHSRPLEGRMLRATICLSADGWHVSFGQQIEADALPNALPSVGIDRGVTYAAVLSNGETITAPARMAALERARRRQHRILARRKRGSKRHAAQRLRIARMGAKIARIRRDWNHRSTTDIARRFGVVALEALNTGAMTRSASGTRAAPGRMVAQKRGLNRAILNIGWRQFQDMLAYKLEAAGGRLVLVDPKYTSQTCSECGAVDARSRKSQAVFECVECGHRANADHNAAINIQGRSTALLGVEGAGYAPDEAPIMAAA
jgi:putative transposase